MANVKILSFSGHSIETTICDRADVADAWIRSIRASYGPGIIAGLDCEWRPNTSPLIENKTAILQICVDTKCLIIQLFYMDYIPQSLSDFLRDPRITFVGVEVERDAYKLKLDYGLGCCNIADVRELTLSRWPGMLSSQPGLKDIADEVVGLKMPKPTDITRSDWQSRTLDDMQIEYACIDAYASYRIGLKLLKGI